ncbi:CapA family protein [Modestobacter marinus]|uniref:Metallophosphatase n=1 Tax=Modestobacter marinus TaxID=477641 RepID=A0ABQ2G6F9_9ACTN|nr:metallophosphatase [Modestobacter marinus]
MRLHRGRWRRGATRLFRTSAAVLLTLAATACGTVSAAQGPSAAGPTAGPTTGSGPTTPQAKTSPTPSASEAARTSRHRGGRVRITGVGDVVMGAAPQLPPDGGRDLFTGVGDRLSGDVVLANLDQALTDVTTSTKCGPDSSGCYAFRAPPSYAERLAEAGFTVVNLANNHTRDFGVAGLQDTREALTAAGVDHTGMPGQITYQRVDDLRVATIGFSPYGWTQSLLDIPAAEDLVREAAAHADVVLVTIHAGGEGSDFQHTRPGVETFLGENRGDPIAFSHAVIDAGADLVLGAGPHVLRGMEWYQGRLIAYSLGNFTGYRALSNDGPKGVGALVTVELTADGSWLGGELVPIRMADPGLPELDPEREAVEQVATLSHEDFGGCGVDVSDDGALTPPTC